MSDRKIVLSISMLISGREEMFQSLESLKYFRDAIPCEVILVDTGCSGEQRRRAEAYADKMVSFTWCDDFAAARNTGLKEATGEWFLYLDDDEWFEEPKEIIDFFQSGEYRKYGSASYAVRNYRDYGKNNYEVSYPTRMSQRNPNLTFVGKIHEQLRPVRNPCKVFSDYVHHYGYVFRTQEERDRHSERNIAPLLEMCAQNPGDPRWAGQLAQEYFGLERLEDVIRVCEDGLAAWKKNRERIKCMPAHVGLLYAYLICCMDRLERYGEEEKWLTEALESELSCLPETEPTVAYYCLRGVGLYSRFEKHTLCREFFRRYLSYEEKLRGNSAAMEAGAAAITGTVFEVQNMLFCTVSGLPSAIRLADYETVEKAIFLLERMKNEELPDGSWKMFFADALCSVEYHPVWGRLLQTIVNTPNGMRGLYPVLGELQTAFQARGESEKLSRLYRLVSESEAEHPYVLECRILTIAWKREAVTEAEKQEIAELFQQLFTRYPSALLKVRQETWDVAEAMGIPMEPLLLQTDYREWRRALGVWSPQTSVEELAAWKVRISLWKSRSDIRYGIFDVKCGEAYVRAGKDFGFSVGEWEAVLHEYAQSVITFYQPCIKEQLFAEESELLPEEVQLALGLRKLEKHRREGDAQAALRQMKECISVYPPLEAALSEYAGLLKDEIRKELEQQDSDKAELEKLAVTLKTVAKLRMERGEWEAAEEILRQLQACMPEDEEAGELLQEIKRKDA